MEVIHPIVRSTNRIFPCRLVIRIDLEIGTVSDFNLTRPHLNQEKKKTIRDEATGWA
jgi:hypothetical protein